MLLVGASGFVWSCRPADPRTRPRHGCRSLSGMLVNEDDLCAIARIEASAISALAVPYERQPRLH